MYLVRIITAALLLGWGSTPVAAQQGRITLSWLPSSLVEPDAGFTFGAEYTLRNNWSILTDAGIIFFNPGNSDDTYRNALLGYKLKPEIRHYFRNRNGRAHEGGFIGLEGLYKHVNYQRYDGLPVLDNMGNLAYTWFGGYRIIKDVWGVSLKLGYRYFFGSRQQWGVEGYMGLGGRHKNFAVRDLPPGGSFDRRFFGERLFNFHWREGGTVSAPMGLKLLWRVR